MLLVIFNCNFIVLMLGIIIKVKLLKLKNHSNDKSRTSVSVVRLSCDLSYFFTSCMVHWKSINCVLGAVHSLVCSLWTKDIFHS